MRGILCFIIGVLLLRRFKRGLVGGAELQIFGLNFTNHSMNATAVATTPSTTETKKSGESNFRSEVYKLHANSLILLHASRTKSVVGSKKSQLNLKSSNTGINYHTRKKLNDTVNAVQDIEKHLEAKLGDLPQVRQKRAKNDIVEKTKNENSLKRSKNDNKENDSSKGASININSNDILNNKSNDALCGQSNSTESVSCQQTSTKHHHHHHHHHHRRSHKHDRKRQWRSIIQGEDTYGEEIKKTKVYPEKFPDRRVNKTTKKDNIDDDQNNNKGQQILITPDESPWRHNRLKRALSLMGDLLDENPLFDSQNGEENKNAGGSSSNKKDNNPLSAAPPIVLPIRNARVKSSSGEMHMKFQGRQFDIKEPNTDMFEDIPDIPPISKIDEDFSIPPIGGIPAIGQSNSRDDIEDDEVGDKRNLVSLENLEHSDIQDQMEKIEPVDRITVPTPIPELSTISNIPEITDIPNLKSIPAPEKNRRSLNSYRSNY